jgi:acyl-coenzyme A synthetase/AMP-(fatty) acid ligase
MSNVASQLIDRHVQANLGQKRALEYGDKHYSYYDLAALANRAGNLLKALGVRPGAAVLLAMPPSPAQVGALIGALKIGALAALGQHAAPALALVHAASLGQFERLGPDKLVVVGEAPQGYRSFVELMRAQASSLAAEALPAAAPAIAASGRTLSHGEVQALLEGGAGDGGLGPTAELLRTLARGETAKLA